MKPDNVNQMFSARCKMSDLVDVDTDDVVRRESRANNAGQSVSFWK